MRLKPETVGFVRGGMLFLEPPHRWRIWQRDIWNCWDEIDQTFAAERRCQVELIAAAFGVPIERLDQATALAWARRRMADELSERERSLIADYVRGLESRL